MRTCRPDEKREAQVVIPRGESIDAGHRGGSVRSSGEVSVMEMERRGRIIQSDLMSQPKKNYWEECIESNKAL